MFYDALLFDFTQEFENNWRAIRDEYFNLDNKILDFYRDSIPYEQYANKLLSNNGWTYSWRVNSNEPNYNWLTYGLSYQGLFPQEAEHKFPITASLLSRLNGLRMCGFSLMKPLSFIEPHSHGDVEGSNILSYHLGLDVVTGKSYLWVNGTFKEQYNGKSIIFDASYEHFALNMSDADRVILYMEFDKTKIAFK
ncbi:MAG: aspartyl/asparaginyl beta-hydroxylase domain-containing protein [Waterburya sp.]